MNGFRTYLRIFYSMQVNSLLYYLKRIPGIGFLISDFVFGRRHLKKVLLVLGIMFSFLKTALKTNIIAYFAISWIPVHLVNGTCDRATLSFWCFLLLYGIGTILKNNSVYERKGKDNLYLNHFMMNPEEYYHFQYFEDIVLYALSFLPVLAIVYRDARLVAVSVLMVATCKCLNCALFLWHFRKTDSFFPCRIRTIAFYTFAAAVYAICYFDCMRMSLSPIWIVGLAIGAVVSLCVSIPVMRHFNAYRRIVILYTDFAPAALSVSVSTQEDPSAQIDTKKCKAEDNQAFLKRHSDCPTWKYWELALEKRTGKRRRDFFLQQVLVAGVLFAGVLICLKKGVLSQNLLLKKIPFLILPIHMNCSGSLLLEMRFRNIDIPMLQVQAYTRKTKRQMMLYRIGILLKNNLLGIVALFGACVGIGICSELSLRTVEYAALLGIIVLLNIMYETMNVSAYYLFVPYTSDFSGKKPAYSVYQYVESLVTVVICFFGGNIGAILQGSFLACGIAVLFLMLVFAFVDRTFTFRHVV